MTHIFSILSYNLLFTVFIVVLLHVVDHCCIGSLDESVTGRLTTFIMLITRKKKCGSEATYWPSMRVMGAWGIVGSVSTV